MSGWIKDDYAFVPISASKFKGAWAKTNDRARLWTRVLDLKRAACVSAKTGVFDTDVPSRLAHHIASTLELAVRVEDHRLYLADDDADQASKKHISYLVSTAIARLFAERVLNAPHVALLEKVRKHGTHVVKTKSDSRRDLDVIALARPKTWHVLEAKGRRDGSASIDPDWKEQVETVVKIDHVAPVTRSVVLTCMSGPISVVAEDPEGGGADLTDDWSSFWLDYYAWIVENVTATPSRMARGPAGIVVGTPIEGVTYGLSESISTWARAGYRGWPPRVRARMTPSVSIGPDGIAVLES